MMHHTNCRLSDELLGSFHARTRRCSISSFLSTHQRKSTDLDFMPLENLETLAHA